MTNISPKSGANGREHVAVLTTSRAEYYQIRTILRALKQSDVLSPRLLVSGSHLSAQFGKTAEEIKADGLVPYELLPVPVDGDSELDAALMAGQMKLEVTGALIRSRTDLLLLAGDMYEMVDAALAAMLCNVPVAHLHGGERTDGALDDSCRHAITKLSSLHFVSTDVYRARVIQMGEAPDRVFTVGAPLVDELKCTELLGEGELVQRLGLQLDHPVALVAYHPATREDTDPGQVCQLILESIGRHCSTIVMTGPNHDSGYKKLDETMQTFVESHNNAKLFANLGSRNFLSVMACADIMVGNSSSGIHEAVSFGLPVVNVGSRQASRLRPRNVLDCAPDASSIEAAVSQALSVEFRRGLAGLENPYGDGRAGERIVKILEQHVPFINLLQKKFCDGAEVRTACAEWEHQHGH